MCRGRWRGGQPECCGRRRASSHRGRELSMWQRQRRACCRGWVVYVQHRLEARRLAHGSRVPAPGRRRMCIAASCGRSDRLLVPSPPWPSTFQQQFVPACEASLSLPRRAHCVATGLCTPWLIASSGASNSIHHIITSSSHVHVFSFTVLFKQSGSRLTIREFVGHLCSPTWTKLPPKSRLWAIWSWPSCSV
jgi:hypothetical protein